LCIGLDLSATFDTVCHSTLTKPLQTEFGVSGTALSILATCTTDVKQWYMQNGLQLNPDKSEALFVGTATQLRAVSSLTSVSVADVDLPVADSMRVFGVTLDRPLTFDNHASPVARSCNHHACAIRHICHLLTQDLVQTLACSMILSRVDYCNSVLHGTPSSTSESRTARRISFYKRLDGQTLTRCFRRCTGCLSNSASSTNWPC